MVQKLYNSIDWLRRRYITQGVSIQDMAREAGVSEMTIRRALETSGLKK